MKIPGAWALFGMKKLDDRERVLLQSRDLPIRHVLAELGKDTDGGWMYRNGWAATTAFDAWNDNTPPMAGEWQDF